MSDADSACHARSPRLAPYRHTGRPAYRCGTSRTRSGASPLRNAIDRLLKPALASRRPEPVLDRRQWRTRPIARLPCKREGSRRLGCDARRRLGAVERATGRCRRRWCAGARAYSAVVAVALDLSRSRTAAIEVQVSSKAENGDRTLRSSVEQTTAVHRSGSGDAGRIANGRPRHLIELLVLLRQLASGSRATDADPRIGQVRT